jgi:rhodanese-related sulfurtransferase
MRRSIVITGPWVAVFAVLVIAIVLATVVVVTHQVRAAENSAAAESVAKGGVTAGEVAQWVVEKRQDYQLVDLREAWHFDDYHIPTAVNIPLAALFTPEGLKRLDQQKKIVVYSLGAGDAARTQLLLAMKGYRAYALTDGIIGWWDEVMTPTSLRSASPSSLGYQQARQLREHFMTGSTISPMPVTTPVAAPPSSPVPAVKATTPAPRKVAPQPAKKKATPPADKEKERLKLGTGCS